MVGFTAQGYASAANYALQNKLDLAQALKWIDIALATNAVLITQHEIEYFKAMGNTAIKLMQVPSRLQRKMIAPMGTRLQ